MPTILAIDAATDACSIALLHQNQIDECFEIAPQQHSRILLPMIQNLMAKHQLTWQQIDAIAFGAGPGSFTGLRIATGVAQGLALAHQTPLIPISNLAALAHQAFQTNPNITVCLPALDARMGEIYFGLYQKNEGDVLALDNDQLAKPAQALQQTASKISQQQWIGIGSGWDLYQDILLPQLTAAPHKIILNEQLHAIAIAQLALIEFEQKHFANIETALPHYLRNDVAHKKAHKI